MHELGVIIEVVKYVEDFAKKNNLKKIDTLVLQIGELSAMIPRYIEACYPAAVDGTMLQDTKLKIEIMPANAICKDCGNVFNVLKNNKVCPKCKGEVWELLCGREFMIKEVVAY
ncbi:hydrogenase maturation nickel metallochaperone HypA [Caloramator sp. mosi_1]|uniref:hydrogenase maturation nickel metallochaperone HypA n=1 Tax=Caloramator sp. mosi_1 TaxID=3023090 RepID=UPI0023627002|nr:hydrogenase maturation nickel metallochaperone HypA [Caloramator sp. mosi_1]WDC83444.1 hydrogenase maturation nickel metallochaperone HypA [Caloramator sp. mosi_1]